MGSGGTARPGRNRSPTVGEVGSQVPVLNGLRCGGCPEFGHEDADDVEKEDKVDLQFEHTGGEKGCGCVQGMGWGTGQALAFSVLALVSPTALHPLPVHLHWTWARSFSPPF